MFGHYNLTLVALSYVISVLGAFTALQLAIGIPQARGGREKRNAILAAGAAMGGGAIWAMHFIAMLAYKMDIPVAYDVLTTLVSALIAIGACSIGLAIAGLGVFSLDKLLLAGFFMGCGVAGMHYTGMAAMLMPAEVGYDLNLLIISVVIAVIASSVALWMAFRMRGSWQIFGSATIAGVAVCGMHYTGMAAARYQYTGDIPPATFLGSMGGDYLGLSIFIISVALLMFSLLITQARRRRRASLAI
ncbi:MULTISPECIES: MHYT domain-containing protein [unclassified Microbulbifer]|uniref:MHYT domain-containing protein n=1 Tax=unclassified Microbulbifer TaxID=2619833 RepID=UPI0027E4D15B|nr:MULTISPECIES: MHYT domain-containing protein [unclassified Microbulbifer]